MKKAPGSIPRRFEDKPGEETLYLFYICLNRSTEVIQS